MGGEDDDYDYAFGDFTFASFPSSSTVHSHHSPQINGPSLTSFPAHTSSSNGDFDDDWSDFVKSPIQSDHQPPNAAPANTGSKPFDPFGFFPQNNNGNANLSVSTQKGEPESTQVEKRDWEKPKGPLPLSLFGDVEEEEEKVDEEKRSGVNDPLGGYGKDSSSRKVENGSNNVSSSVGFDNVIANLHNYNNNQQIKAEQNGFSPNLLKSDAKGVGLNDKDSILGLSELNLSSASVDVKKDLDNNDRAVKNEDKFKFNSNGSVSYPNADASGLDRSGSSLNFSSSSLINSSGWGLNFSGSSLILNDQSEPNKGENIGSNMSRLGPNQNALELNLSASSPAFGGWSLDFGGFSSGANTLDAKLNASSSNFNGLSPNRRNEELDANGDDNNDDDEGWEFQGAIAEAKVTEAVNKADPETHKMTDINTRSSGFGGGSNRSIDLFAFSDGSVDLFSMSNGVSGDFGRVGTENIKPTTAPRNSFNLDKSYRIEQTGVKSRSDFNPLARAPENDDDFEEFTAAFPETGLKKDGEVKADDIFVVENEATTSGSREQVKGAARVHDVSQLNAFSPSYGNQSSRPVDLFAFSNESVDFFGMSNGFSSASLGVGTGFDSMPSTAAQSGFISTIPLNKELVDIKDGLDPRPVLEGDENDEDFGEFTAAFPDATERQHEGEFASDQAKSDLGEIASDGKDQKMEMNENKGGALPLSIFGDQELEVDDTLKSQNTFLHSPSPVQRNGLSPAKVISIDDIISNLYSQAEQSSSVDALNGTTDIEVRPTEGVNADLLKDPDDFDDGSWEFKEAFAAAAAENEKSHGGPEGAHRSSPSIVDAYESNRSNGRLDDYIEFYSKLKDGLSFVMKFHLEKLKEARNNATLSGKDDKVMALDEEIQEVYKLLDQETVILQEDNSEGHLTGDSSLNKFLEALLEQKFQILESEYGLSRRLLLAEKDLRSAVDLRKHAVIMLKILSFGSSEDHLTYISIWSKMISVCFQELQSGANIWKQSSERNVQNELLAEPEGKKFLQALGEIYRAAMVLGASAELYKPWTLESSAESANIYALLDECISVWSASGLGEALSDLLHSTSINDNSGFAALVESIQYIRNLDLMALQDHVFTRQKSRCRLSLLTSETIPGMKVVAWDGERYFVKLANLWANLIGSDPPRLPHLHSSVDVMVG